MADTEKVKTASTEYLYSTARIRAMENSLCTTAKVGRCLEARTVEEVLGSIAESGIEVIRKPGSEEADIEETLNARLARAFDTVSGMIPSPKLVDFLRYPYDCHNVKAVIKCFARSIDPEGMLFEFGTVPAEEVAALAPEFAAGVFQNDGQDGAGKFPPHMRRAAYVAAAEFARTKNPQLVDLILDRACFADMAEFAAGCGVPYISELVNTRTDMQNVLIVCRLLRMPRERAEELWNTAILPGGTLDRQKLHDALGGDEDTLISRIASTKYRAFAAEVAQAKRDGGGFPALEKAADNAYVRAARSAKTVSFGPEVAIGYLVAVETEIKNLRIILTGRVAGLSNAEIRERVRESYV